MDERERIGGQNMVGDRHRESEIRKRKRERERERAREGERETESPLRSLHSTMTELLQQDAKWSWSMRACFWSAAQAPAGDMSRM